MRLSGRLGAASNVVMVLLVRVGRGLTSNGGRRCRELTAPAGEEARLVDTEHSHQPAIASVCRKEAAVIAAAFFDRDLVVGTGDTRELDPRAVLVGPEVGRLDRGALVDAPRKQRRDGDRGPFQRARPVLDAVCGPGRRVVPRSAVTDRDDVRDVRLTIGP